jgi:methionyl-tRNA formyltransferase
MRIIPSTKSSYAHVEWDSTDQQQIQKLLKGISSAPLAVPSLEGLKIEVSAHDILPEATRNSLIDGRFLAIDERR